MGIYLARRFEDWTQRKVIFLISFAIGVLLSSAFLELLPEAAAQNYSWFYWTLAAIVLFYLLEHFITIHIHSEKDFCEGQANGHTLGTISFLGLGFHSLIDGVVIGVSFGVSFNLGFLASLAIILHETAEGIFTYTMLIRDKIFGQKALFLSYLVALATPLGAILTFLFLPKGSAGFLGALLAFAAGSFIYIGASDLVPETHKKHNRFNIFLVLLGILFVFLIGKFLE